MSDAWHILGDYLGACLIFGSLAAALHYRGKAKGLAEDLCDCERELAEAHETLAGPLDDEPKTPRSA